MYTVAEVVLDLSLSLSSAVACSCYRACTMYTLLHLRVLLLCMEFALYSWLAFMARQFIGCTCKLGACRVPRSVSQDKSVCYSELM